LWLLSGCAVNSTTVYTVVLLTAHPLVSSYTHNGDGRLQKRFVAKLKVIADAVRGTYIYQYSLNI